MQDNTKNAYRKLARHFYTHHMRGKEVTGETVKQSLAELASDFCIAYFRRLKNAIAFDFAERNLPDASQSILKLANPVTVAGSHLTRKAKPVRAKRFSDPDLAKIVEQLAAKEHHAEWAALTLIRFTGARPAELKTMRMKDGVVIIFGAKKSHAGTRGSDRMLAVDDQGTRSIIENCIKILATTDQSMDAIRHRLRDEGCRLWPRRTTIPGLYSMRHQFGANLKASCHDARTIAYIMGHQSTASASVYGDRRSGDASAIRVSPVQGAQLEKVRSKVIPASKRRFEAMIFEKDPDAPGNAH